MGSQMQQCVNGEWYATDLDTKVELEVCKNVRLLLFKAPFSEQRSRSVNKSVQSGHFRGLWNVAVTVGVCKGC